MKPKWFLMCGHHKWNSRPLHRIGWSQKSQYYIVKPGLRNSICLPFFFYKIGWLFLSKLKYIKFLLYSAANRINAVTMMSSILDQFEQDRANHNLAGQFREFPWRHHPLLPHFAPHLMLHSDIIKSRQCDEAKDRILDYKKKEFHVYQSQPNNLPQPVRPVWRGFKSTIFKAEKNCTKSS